MHSTVRSALLQFAANPPLVCTTFTDSSPPPYPLSLNEHQAPSPLDSSLFLPTLPTTLLHPFSKLRSPTTTFTKTKRKRLRITYTHRHQNVQRTTLSRTRAHPPQSLSTLQLDIPYHLRLPNFFSSLLRLLPSQEKPPILPLLTPAHSIYIYIYFSRLPQPRRNQTLALSLQLPFFKEKTTPPYHCKQSS